MRIQKRSMTSHLLGSLAIVAVMVVVAWFALSLVGVHFSLFASLAISLVLTAALTLGMNAFHAQRHA